MLTLAAPIPRTTRSDPLDKDAVESCFGLGCLRRGSCWRYRAVEWVAAGSTTQASCLHRGGYPKYVPIDAERG